MTGRGEFRPGHAENRDAANNCGTSLTAIGLEWEQVRHNAFGTIWFRLSLAFIVLFGTSWATFAGLICAGGACPSSCDMHAKAESAAPKVRSCCKGETEESARQSSVLSGECNCEIKSGDGVPTIKSAIAELPIPLVVALPTEDPARVVTPVWPTLRKVHLHSGNPPPTLARYPDLGRAPPVA